MAAASLIPNISPDYSALGRISQAWFARARRRHSTSAPIGAPCNSGAIFKKAVGLFLFGPLQVE